MSPYVIIVLGVLFFWAVLFLIHTLNNVGYPTTDTPKFQLEIRHDYTLIKFNEGKKWKYVENGYTESPETFKNPEQAEEWITKYLTKRITDKQITIRDVNYKVLIS